MSEISPRADFINTGHFQGCVRSKTDSYKINYHAWALHEIFNVRNAATLWCGINPYSFAEWSECQYVEVLNTTLYLISHSVKMDIESNPGKYSIEQLDSAFKIIKGRCNEGVSEFLKESDKYMLTRNQLKAIAEKIGAKPEFLYFENTEQREFTTKTPLDNLNIENTEIETPEDATEAVGDDDDTTHNEREYTTWLRETWVEENSPTGAPFFKALKYYKAKEGSPIIDWWNSSINGPGIRLRTSTREIELPKIQIQKIVSKFKLEVREQKKPVK